MNDLVSVIIATYRREAELISALESLAEQTYKNFETVVVDDNADADWNSKVKNAVEEFCKNNPSMRVNYIANSSNRGSARTRNIGIDAANGEYITFLDDDDIYLPSKIERQLSFMKEKALDYCITDLYLYSENGKLVDKRVRDYISDTSSESLLREHLKHHITGTDTLMFKRDYLMKIGKFPLIDMGDEFYLMMQAIENNGKFGYLEGCDVKAYVHGENGGMSSGAGKIIGENELYEFKKNYFHRLKARDVRYVKARHYAVLAFAYLRSKKYGQFLANGCLAVLVSPINCLKILMMR